MKITLPTSIIENLINNHRHDLIHSSCTTGCITPADIDTLDGFIDTMGDAVHKLMDPIIAATQICIDLYINAVIIPDTKQIIMQVNHDALFELLIDEGLIQQFGYTNLNHDEYKMESGFLFISLPSRFISDSVYIWGSSSIVDHVDYGDFFNQVRAFGRHKELEVYIDRPKRGLL